MHKSTLLLTLCILMFILPSCNQDGGNVSTKSRSDSSTAHQARMLLPGEDTSFITIDTANKMIDSYLGSVQTAGDSSLHSLIIDANALREYLTSDSGSEITHLKIMFAHRLNYINTGGKDKPCGYSPVGFTVILAGVNAAGNYSYYKGNNVEDLSRPCPYNCITDGSASSDRLVR